MRINHNISAMRANRQLSTTGTALSNSLERLSSGYRINKAADDAAGMAISRKMKTQIEGLEQASRNGADGISVIQTAEGALTEVSAMLQRMRELSVQAANGTNTAHDRSAIQMEINELNEEIQRISDETEFNTKPLLNGNIDNYSYSDNDGVNLIYVTDGVEAKPYTVGVTRDARQAVLVGDVPTISGEIFEEEAGVITINGYDIDVTEGQDLETIYENIRGACDVMGLKAFFGYGPSDEGLPENAFYELEEIGFGNLIIMTENYGSDQTVEVQCNNEELCSLFGFSREGVTARGVDAEGILYEGYAASATIEGKGDVLYVKDNYGFEMRYQVKPGVAETDFTDAPADGSYEAEYAYGAEAETVVTVLDAGPMDLQVGANEDQIMTLRIPRIDPTTLGTARANVCTEEGAQLSISIFDSAVNEVSMIRAKLGAYQNRLDHAINNLNTGSENITEAMSRIEDVNMATEMTTYTQKDVLEQAGTAMLAQANQRPENILALLNG